MYPMFAGVPRTKPSAASTSGAPAESAGTTVTSIPSSSGSRAPAMTASSIACSAGDGVWWTTSSRGNAHLPQLVTLWCLVLGRLTLGYPAERRAERGGHVGKDLHVVLVLEAERQRERDLGDLTEPRGRGQPRGDPRRGSDDVPREQQPLGPDRRGGARRPRRHVGLVLRALRGRRGIGRGHHEALRHASR